MNHIMFLFIYFGVSDINTSYSGGLDGLGRARYVGKFGVQPAPCPEEPE